MVLQELSFNALDTFLRFQAELSIYQAFTWNIMFQSTSSMLILYIKLTLY